MFASSSLVAAIPAVPFVIPYFGLVDLDPLLAALTIFIVINIVCYVLKNIVLARLRSWSERTVSSIDDVIVKAVDRIRPFVYITVSAVIALSLFPLPPMIGLVLWGIALILLAWQAIEIVLVFITFATERLVIKDEDHDGIIDPGAATASEMIQLIARIVLWILGGLFVLSNLGIEITSLIAGLGIGGIAVAFALQGILSDLFASFSIYFDRPFRVGDFVVIGSNSGTVEKIGIKTTRIRTLQGEELVVSNAELTTIRVQNFKKMDERRIVMNFGVIYETPHETVVRIPEIVKECFTETLRARLDRVHFTTFGDSALLFEVVYFINSADYNEYLDVQQSFNLELMRRFKEEQIEFAYPTQMIYTKPAA